MKKMFRNVLVIARRDFMAVTATPSFLVFLMTPLFLAIFAFMGAYGSNQVVKRKQDSSRIVALLPVEEEAIIEKINVQMKQVSSRLIPPLEVRTLEQSQLTRASAQQVFDEPDSDTHAVLLGPIKAPTILEEKKYTKASHYLESLVRQARLYQSQVNDNTARAIDFEYLDHRRVSNSSRYSLAYGAITTLFFLSLLFGGQTLAMIAEEKSNKIIEILASSMPLESLFLGKLLGFLGVSFLFISFWLFIATMITIFIIPILLIIGTSVDKTEQFEVITSTIILAPATGWPFFLLFCFLYFIMAFLLMGAMFLGVGALATTMREIQMLSMPVAIFQFAIFSIAVAGTGQPDSTLAEFTQIFPFTSPFAMAAQAATDDKIFTHLIMLGWQALWVVIVIGLAVRLFRAGVLNNSGALVFWRQKSAKNN